MSIYNAYIEIEQRRMFLPALQRRFVWERGQIELLFDSIMRGYPFGTFLFWRLAKETANKYIFYEFKKLYDERYPFNEKKIGTFSSDIVGVLDGQQRLSSIYIGLQGTYTEKRRGKWRRSLDAYQETRLYLNLLSLPYQVSESGSINLDESKNFEFRFLPKDVVDTYTQRKVEGDNKQNEPLYEAVYWFPVVDIMTLSEKFPKVSEDINIRISLCKDTQQVKSLRANRRIINYGMKVLHKAIHEKSGINYFEIDKNDLEDILKIFVRVNSGGTVLSKADLLFSTIVATWGDGRKNIEALLKKINSIGFNFGTEYLMRCCLVLSDGPVSYNVRSFQTENVKAIRDRWPLIEKAIIKTVELLRDYGFSKETLASNNATIPIAYYIYKKGTLNQETKESLRMYLISSLLKRVFSSHQDQVLSHFISFLRKVKNDEYVLRDEYKKFDFSRFVEEKTPVGKSLKVTSDDIDHFLEYQKGDAAFTVLSVLYPQLQYGRVELHQDHLHPAAGFSKKHFIQLKLTKEQQEQWLTWRDQVPNLQLLEGSDNKSKNATPLKDWLQKMSEVKKSAFSDGNYFPEKANLDFAMFPEFFCARREKMRTKLMEILNVTKTSELSVAEDEIDRVSDEDLEGAVFERQEVT
jgi:uncharacterized protein with ParB-like and HNH nuclease domain